MKNIIIMDRQTFSYAFGIVSVCLIAIALGIIAFNPSIFDTNDSSSNNYSYQSYSTTSNSSNSNYSNQYDVSSTKWKEFAGTRYRASQWVSNGVDAVVQNYAFIFDNTGKGKYIIFGTYPGSHVVTDQMNFNIYSVESDADYLYLYCSELNTPVKVLVKGHSLYTKNGAERYEVWQ